MPIEFANALSSFFKVFGPYIIWGGLMVGLILIMVLPQRKREKKAKEMLNGIKTGDKIRTIGGMCGKVTEVRGDVVVFACGPAKSRIVIAKNAIATVQNSDVENTTTLTK